MVGDSTFLKTNPGDRISGIYTQGQVQEEMNVMEKNQNYLLKEMTAALERDPRIDIHHWPINIRMLEGQMVLEGIVENIAAKRVTLTVAQQIAGENVVDNLRVNPAEHKEDNELRNAVTNSLLQEPVLRECSIRVRVNGDLITLRAPAYDPDGEIIISVKKGIVSLNGNVRSLSHLRLAEVLTWWNGGCEVVENTLHVIPPEEDNDGEITDAIRMVQEKDPLVHASQLSVSTGNGVVTLAGYVASKEEKKLAVLDAWYVPGVRDVVDRIESRI